ncbi:MAG: YxcD family protein [Sporolactobacillus sp.]
MAEMILTEQEIVNAICLYVSEKKQLAPQDVEVELVFDDDYGYSADVYVKGRKQVLVESNMIEAVRNWLASEMNIDPYAASLQFALDEAEGMQIRCQT